jgi:amicyanin
LKGLNHAKINSCKLARTGGLNALMALLVMHGNANAADAQVKIANFTFEPPVLTLKVGTTVTWVNDDDIPHLVSEKDGKFRSSALDTNETFSETFKDAGTIEYFCVLHPHMTGKIVVEP